VVTKHFSDRRAETRRLLESAEFGSETTGEVRVENVLAKVRAGAASASAPPAAEARRRPPRKPSLVAAPRAAMPREENEFTRPGVMPGDLKHPPQPAASEGTSPARPAPCERHRPAVGAGPGGVTVPSPALSRPFKYEEDDDDDEAGDKTIPAAALPDEIKNLRAQFAAARKNSVDKAAAVPPRAR